MIVEFIEGQHIDHPSQTHKVQLIQKAAELQCVTKVFNRLIKIFVGTIVLDCASNLPGMKHKMLIWITL